jgi:hypothetical protein
VRGLRGVTFQLAAGRAGGGIPEPADHVVGNARDETPVGRGDDFPDPFRVGFRDVMHRAHRGGVPPDEGSVPRSRNEPGSSRREGESGDIRSGTVAEIPLEHGGHDRIRPEVGVEDPAVRTPEKDPLRTRQAGEAEEDVLTRDLAFLGEAEAGRGIAHALRQEVGGSGGFQD